MNRLRLTVRLHLAGLAMGTIPLLSGCGLGTPCGGVDGAVCEADSLCWHPVGLCGDGGLAGVCIPRPEACVQIFAPVCGCDGETYANDCVAHAAGVSIRHDGECNGQVCGGIIGAPCDDGEYCKLPDGQCCCDIQGVCTPMPEVCPELFAPVCGCDGRTYGNACEAAAAGVSIDSQGECPADDGGGPG